MMDLSRRDFLRYCGLSAAAIGLSASDLGLLKDALANPAAPTVVWLQGSSCTGCSVSFLNRISTTAPATAADVLISSINLAYHPTVMAASGATAVAAAKAAYDKGNYILVVEGGVPTAFGGACGWAWSDGGRDVTMLEAIRMYAAKAAKIVCAGTCASWGGIPSAPPNPAGIVGIKAATGKTTVNIAGCPAHPDWICWAIVQLLTGQAIAVDAAGRPTALYGYTLHDICPRNGLTKAAQYGVDNQCLMNLGCHGPVTKCQSAMTRWNNGVSWCIEANAPCIGCTEPTFPGTAPLYPKQG